MNDLLKLFSRCLGPFGYHIKPRQGSNFLFVPNLNNKAYRDVLAVSRVHGYAAGHSEIAGLDGLQIFFRTCVRKNRNVDTRPRVTGAPLEESMLRCFNSLLVSIAHARRERPSCRIDLTVLDDRSDAAILDAMRKLIAESGIGNADIRTTEATGQGESLYEQFSLARALPARMVYFIEDDYLHEQDAIYRLCAFYQRMSKLAGSHLVLYPQEHPVMYTDHYPSYIVAGEDRHWRTIRHTTHSFFTHTDVVRQYWKYFENTKYVGNRKKRRLGSENRTTNRIFNHIPAFAPLRPLAVHLQFPETLPPFYEWERLWQESRPGGQKIREAG